MAVTTRVLFFGNVAVGVAIMLSLGIGKLYIFSAKGKVSECMWWFGAFIVWVQKLKITKNRAH